MSVADAGISFAHRQWLDELLQPLATLPQALLDREIARRLAQAASPACLRGCLVVAQDHGATGLEQPEQRFNGSLPADLQGVYSALICDRDPLAIRAQQQWRPAVAPISQHVAALRAQVRNPDLYVGWLQRVAETGASALAVVPARAALSRATLLVFLEDLPGDAEVLALFYAAQRLAVALEARLKPYLDALLALRFTARELEVLRAGLRGASDEDIAAGLSLSVDAIRYYYKKFKLRVPGELGHLRPRDLSRVLHHLGKL